MQNAIEIRQQVLDDLLFQAADLAGAAGALVEYVDRPDVQIGGDLRRRIDGLSSAVMDFGRIEEKYLNLPTLDLERLARWIECDLDYLQSESFKAKAEAAAHNPDMWLAGFYDGQSVGFSCDAGTISQYAKILNVPELILDPRPWDRRLADCE